MVRRRFLAVLAALLLILAQQGMLLHALKHHEIAGGAPSCEQCVAFAAVSGTAPAAAAPAVALVESPQVFDAPASEEFLPLPALAFSARAPPAAS
jgi:hypothetical protein